MWHPSEKIFQDVMSVCVRLRRCDPRKRSRHGEGKLRTVDVSRFALRGLTPHTKPRFATQNRDRRITSYVQPAGFKGRGRSIAHMRRLIETVLRHQVRQI